jgi:hypothetical protein
MVLAYAMLLLQFAPTAPVFADVNLGSAAPAVKAAANSKPDQPQPANSTSAASASSKSSTSNSKVNALPIAFTFAAASLDNSSQNGQALETIRVPDVAPAKPVKILMPETHPRRAWLLLSMAEHSAATFDAYSTRLAISKGATEADPLMQPFAHSPALYGAIQVCPLVLDFAARRMERSQHGLLRRTWWLPQSAATGIFLFSGAHNLNVANSIHQ